MVDPYNFSAKEEDYFIHEKWFKQTAKELLDELKQKFESYEKRKLSDREFNDMYTDYFHSGLALPDYFELRKLR